MDVKFNREDVLVCGYGTALLCVAPNTCTKKRLGDLEAFNYVNRRV
jgi:hypothetical protein